MLVHVHQALPYGGAYEDKLESMSDGEASLSSFEVIPTDSSTSSDSAAISVSSSGDDSSDEVTTLGSGNGKSDSDNSALKNEFCMANTFGLLSCVLCFPHQKS